MSKPARKDDLTFLSQDGERLYDVSAQLVQLEEERGQLVARLRAGGASWDHIGAATGMSRQAAWERWRDRSSRRRREHPGQGALPGTESGAGGPPEAPGRGDRVGRASRARKGKAAG